VARPQWTPTLDDYLTVAAFILGTTPGRLQQLPRIGLAESALHAPFAGFGGSEAYPDLVDQAAVLIAHLAQNHPLPDGNKRAAFLLAARFLDANGRSWRSQDTDRDASMVERIAASQATHDEIADWIKDRTHE
jgi:death on curing protein